MDRRQFLWTTGLTMATGMGGHRRAVGRTGAIGSNPHWPDGSADGRRRGRRSRNRRWLHAVLGERRQRSRRQKGRVDRRGRRIESRHRFAKSPPPLSNNRKSIFLFGNLLANTGLAVANYVKGNGTPYFIPVIAADNLTQRSRVKNVIRAGGYTASQFSRPLADWAPQAGATRRSR